MKNPFALAVLGVFLFGAAAAAEGPTVPPAANAQNAESLSVGRFGETDPSCAEWTDGCVVCVKGDAMAHACSLPGIACLPKAITCAKPVQPGGPH